MKKKDLRVQVLPFGFAQGRRCAQDDNIVTALRRP